MTEDNIIYIRQYKDIESLMKELNRLSEMGYSKLEFKFENITRSIERWETIPTLKASK